MMAARATGFAMFSAASVQEAQDFSLIAHAATLESRIPFSSYLMDSGLPHEIAKIETLTPDIMQAMIHEEWVRAHHARALSPDHPVIRGTAQNPDVFFQAREAANRFYQACKTKVMRRSVF